MFPVEEVDFPFPAFVVNDISGLVDGKSSGKVHGHLLRVADGDGIFPFVADDAAVASLDSQVGRTVGDAQADCRVGVGREVCLTDMF